MDKEVVEIVSGLVSRGWQGLITLYVVWAVVKQFKVWQEKRELEKLGVKHNPSPEIHAAIDQAITPLRDELRVVRADVADVRDRVARVEGHLDF